jgi:hypothetical protein
VINPSDLTGVEETLARRVIIYARSIAPCLDSLVDVEGDENPKPRSDAIAILVGVAAEVPRPGARRVKRERIGPADAEYFQVSSAFTDDDRAGLRALCSASESTGGLPVGSFPKSARVITSMWPEQAED